MASVLSVPLQDDVTANLGSNSFEVQTDPRGSQRSGRRSGGSQRAAMAEGENTHWQITTDLILESTGPYLGL